MPIKKIRFDTISFHRRAARLSALALLVVSTSFAATSAMASDKGSLYQTERAMCNSGQSNQDRATCLREAGAAQAESKKGRLSGDQNAYRQNALIRCNALPADDREACQRRISGEGTTNGSIGTGGVIRELVVPDKK